MLFWGPPSKFVGGSWEPKQDKSEIRLIDDMRTADRLLNWINKKIGRYEKIIYCFLNLIFKNIVIFEESRLSIFIKLIIL